MNKPMLTSSLRSSLAVMVLALAVSGHAHASAYMVSVPEIDPSVAASGLALLSGVVLMVRGRRSK